MILAVLQARVSSSRLPGKVLRPILGRPMLALQIERVLRATMIDRFVVATSRQSEDDALASLAADAGVECFRGSLEDVLDRFYQAVSTCRPAHVIRLTGDCPLADPQLIDACILQHLEQGNDYTANVAPPTFPDGLDVEVMRFSALEAAWAEARLGSEREHVTPFIRHRPERFRLGNLTGTHDHSALRWTVDVAADFEFVANVYAALYPANPAFTTQDVLDLLAARPELRAINAGQVRNAGYLKSLAEDERQHIQDAQR